MHHPAQEVTRGARLHQTQTLKRIKGMKQRYKLLAGILTSTLIAFPSFAEVTKVMTVDATGEQMAVDSNGQLIYIADQKHDQLVIVDSSTLQEKHRIDLPANPEDVALDEEANKVYITLTAQKEIVAYDLQSYLHLDSIALPESGNELVVGRDYIYITPLSGRIGIMRVDKSTGNYVDHFSNGVSIYRGGGLELTSDKTKLVFANRGLSPGTVAIWDLSGPSPDFQYKNEHGALGSNGQDLSIDPLNGEFFSYAAGGGNGQGYTIAKVSMYDLAWSGEFDTGPYPRSVHYSNNGTTLYSNNRVDEVKVWDHNLFQLTGNFSVQGNPKDYADAQNAQLLGVLSDREFAIYQVGEFSPTPPQAELSGALLGTNNFSAVCHNQTSDQVVQLVPEDNKFDCAKAGLTIEFGDEVTVTLNGIVE